MGDIRPVHDPAIIKEGGSWYVFSTGNANDATGLLPWRGSPNLTDWTYRGRVFDAVPAWVQTAVPGASGIWAPDIVFAGGQFRLYYSVSTFGSNRSAIGMATSPTLNPAAPGYGWTDQGVVFQSSTSDNYNAIDPNVFTDTEGRQWMAFGSFWTGIKMIRLDPTTGKRLAGDATLVSLAQRPAPGAIEAPFVIRRGGFYYLFASFDACCQGSNSTYYTVVGRASDPAGPYVDRAGIAMLSGGGTVVLTSGRSDGSRFVGRGHVAILRETDRDYIVYHAYDTQANGAPTLQIQPLGWTDDGWPVVQ
jgi:arabinan endo-1,5-alpha-L-arabinosidase